MVYGAVNPAVLERVPSNARRILDLGCGTGALGGAIKKRQQATVIGVTSSEEEAQVARTVLDQTIVADLNTFSAAALPNIEMPAQPGFDAIIASHVLEHLNDPGRLLREVRSVLNGRLLVALPNVLHWRQRLAFLRGHFRYTDGGLMDRTHLRFYDWQTAQELLQTSGYEIQEALADGTFPGSRFLGAAGRTLSRGTARALPGLLGFQWVFVCRKGGASI